MKVSQHFVGAAVFALFGVFAAGYWAGQQFGAPEAEASENERQPASLFGATVDSELIRGSGRVVRIQDGERTCYAALNVDGGAAIECPR